MPAEQSLHCIVGTGFDATAPNSRTILSGLGGLLYADLLHLSDKSFDESRASVAVVGSRGGGLASANVAASFKP